MDRVGQESASHCYQIHATAATEDASRITPKAKRGRRNKAVIVQEMGERERREEEQSERPDQPSLQRPAKPSHRPRPSVLCMFSLPACDL